MALAAAVVEIQWAGIWCLPGFPFLEEFSVDKITLSDVVAEYCAAHAVHCKAMGVSPSSVSQATATASLADIIKQLRAKGIPWASLLGVIGPILAAIFAGTPIGAIIASILALLNPPAPTPVPMPNPAGS